MRGAPSSAKTGYTSAQVEVLGKYDDAGKLLEIGIAFRGTSGPRENLIVDSIGDVISDLLAAFGPADYAKTTRARRLAPCLAKSPRMPALRG